MQRILAVGLTLLAVGCARDLEIPAPPERAALFGAVDTGGHIPLAGNAVTLIRSENGDRFAQQTDEAGAFRFPDLSPGTYTLKLALPGFAPLTEGPYLLRGQELDAGTLTPAWLAQTPSEAVLTGRVVVASGNNGGADGGSLDGGMNDDAGTRAADSFGATVRFLLQNAGNTPVDEVTVNAFGSFTTRLPPGVYTVEATHPYYVADTRPDVTLGEGARVDLTAQPLVLQLNPAEVRGQIFREIDNDATALPAVGARVTSDTGLSVDTDLNGRFVLGGLAAGARTLTISLAEHHDGQPSRTLQLGAGENAVLAPITLLLDRGDLTGEVSMGDGSPLQQVSVEIPGTSYNANVTQLSATPERGRYTIQDVPVGNYNVRASRPNYIAAVSATVRVRANQPVAVDLLTLARIQGDFVIDDGDPTNTVGFTRVRDVTLQVTNAANTAAYRAAEGSAANLASAAWVPFASTTIPFQLSSGDGPKPIYLQLRDTSMTEGPPLTATIVLDETAPTSVTFQLAGGAEFSRVANPIPATLSGVDPGSGIASFRMQEGPSDGGALSTPRQAYLRDTSFTRSSSADGLQVVVAQLIDNAGNVSVVVQDQVVIDTFAPTGSITITRGAQASRDGYTRDALVQLAESVSMPEPLGGYVQVKLANDLADLSTAVLQPVKPNAVWALEPSEGLKTLHYVFVDAAGNEGAAGTATVRLDRTAPVIAATLTSPSPTNSLVLSLSLSLTEANELSPSAGLTLSESAFFTGAAGTVYPSNDLAQFTLPAGDGNRELFVRVRDAAGNEGATSVPVVVDQTPPTNGTLTLTGALGDGSASTTLTAISSVTVISTVTGATGILLGGSALTCPTTPGSYSAWNGAPLTGHALPGTGLTRQVNACFIDAAGNVRGPLSATIDLDGAIPTGCAVRLTGVRKDGATTTLRKTADRTVPVTLSGCSEVPVEVFFTEATTISCNALTSVNWQAWSATTLATVTLSTGENLKSVQGCVRDRALNVGTLAVDTLTLDTTPPTAPTVTIDSGAAYVNRTQYLARGGYLASVAGAATGATEWAIAESATPGTFTDVAVGNPVDFTFTSGDGVKTIRALFRDDVGNVTPVEASDSVEFDTSAPTLTGLTLTGTTSDGNASTLISGTLTVSAALVQTGATGIYKADAITTCPTAGYESFSGSSVPVILGGTGTTRSLAVCVSDAAGNVAGPLSDSIDVDLTTPTGCALVLNGRRVDGSATSGATADKTARIDLAANLNACSETPVEIAFSESAITCSATASLDWRTLGTGTVALNLSSGDGPKTVFGCVRDRARNVGSFTSDSITLDTMPPTGATLVVEGGNAWVNRARSLATGGQADVTGTATGATEWAVVEGGTPSVFQAFTSPATLRIPMAESSDGIKTVRALFRDDVGNVTPTEASDSIEFDTVLPTFTALVLSGTLADGSPSTVVSSTASVSAALTQTGATRALVGDQNLTTCPATGYTAFAGSALAATLPGSATTRTLTVCLSDEAGNLAAAVPLSDSIDVDTSAPTSCAVALTGKRVEGSNTSGTTIDKTARIDVTAALASCSETPLEVVLTESLVTCSATATLDWRAVGTGVIPLALSSGDGSKRVYGCVRDRARNVGSATFDDITLDTTPPTNASVVLDLGAPYVNRAQWTTRGGVDNIASARGTATGATEWAREEISAPSTFTAFATSPLDLDFTFTPGDGVKTLRVLFRDDVGNVTQTESTDSITFDTALPTLSQVTLQGALADGTPSESVTATAAVTATVVQVDAVSIFQSTSAIATCPVGGYQPYSGGTVGVNLSGAGPTRSVWMCIKDAAGNIAGPVSDDIGYDNTAATGCTVDITGYLADGRNPSTGSVAAITGSTDVDLTLTGCSEVPTEVALSESAVTCVNGGNLTWQAYTPGMRFTLSKGDELKTIRGCVRDATLNVGSFVADSVTLDTTPPSGVTLSLAAGATYTTTATVTAAVTGSDAVSNTDARLSMQLWRDTNSPAAPVPFSASSPVNLGTTQGPHTVTVRVLDEMGNASEYRDDIEFDNVPPIAGPRTVLINGGFAATNSSTVTLALIATGATKMKLHAYQQPSSAGGACTTAPTLSNADFDAEAEVPFVSSLTYVLPPSETASTECKWVGVRFGDAAGNYSSITSDDVEKILLDTVAPDAPQIDTPSQVANLSTIDVLLSANAADLHLTRYQALFAGATGWVNVATVGVTNPRHLVPSCLNGPSPLCSIQVGLAANSGNTTPNKENLISLRGVDIAGNVSATASITIVRDHADPTPPTNFIAIPGNGQVTLTWAPSTAPDLAGYQVRYMLSPGGTCPTVPSNYGGTFADQGASPIDVGRNRSLLLSGVPNGVALCVAVQAYDGTQTPERRESTLAVMGVTPFEVAPSLRARLTGAYLGLSGSDRVGAVVVRNGLLYAATTQGLKELDVSNEGCFELSSAAEFQSCVGLVTSAVALTDPRDLVLHGRFAYVADGLGGLRVFSITEGFAPAYVRTVTLTGVTGVVRGVAASGNLLAVAHPSGYALMTLSTMSNPTVQKVETAMSTTYDVDLQGEWMMIARSSSTQNMFFDVSAPAAPVQTATAPCDLAGSPTAVKVSGRYAYYLTTADSLEICSLATTANPRPVLSVSAVEARARIEIHGPYLFSTGNAWNNELGNYSQFLDVTDISTRSAARFVGRYYTPTFSYVAGYTEYGSIAPEGNRVFMATGLTPNIEVIHVGEPRSFDLVASDDTALGSNDTRAIKDQLVVPRYSSQAPEALVGFRRLGLNFLEEDTVSTVVPATVLPDTDYVTALHGTGYRIGVLANQFVSPEILDSVSARAAPTPAGGTQWKVQVGSIQWPHLVTPALSRNTTTDNWTVQVQTIDLRQTFSPYGMTSAANLSTTILDQNLGAPDNPFNTIQNLGLYGGYAFVAVATSGNEFNVPQQAAEGIWRVPVGNTGFLGAPTQVFNAAAVVGVLPYGRFLYYWTRQGNFFAQPLASPTWAPISLGSSQTVAGYTNESNSTNGRFEFSGNYLYAPRRTTGFKVFRVIHAYNVATSRYEPQSIQQVLSYDVGSYATSLILRGDTLFVNNQERAFDIFRMR